MVPTYGAVWVPRRVAVGLGALQHRPLGLRSLLRLDLGGRRALGLGAVSLRPLGPPLRLLGLVPRPHRGAPVLRAGARRLLRRRGLLRRRHDRNPVRRLGGPRLGRAAGPLVGAGALPRLPALGRAGAGRATSTTSRTITIRCTTCKEINVYRNARVRDAIVAVDRDHFGRRSPRDESFTRGRADRLAPLHGDPGVRPDRSSLVADARSARRPPRETWQRSVVATREPRIDAAPGLESRRGSADEPAARSRAPARESGVAGRDAARARGAAAARGRTHPGFEAPALRHAERRPSAACRAPAPRFEQRARRTRDRHAPPAARDSAARARRARSDRARRLRSATVSRPDPPGARGARPARPGRARRGRESGTARSSGRREQSVGSAAASFRRAREPRVPAAQRAVRSAPA